MAEILQNAGIVEIRNTFEDLYHQLLGIESAGRTCYQSEESPPTLESAAKFVRMLIKRGHESVLEHTRLTVRFSNCSRGMTHEHVRHRLASYSQESTRYVNESNLRVTLHPEADVDQFIAVDPLTPTEYMVTPREMINAMEGWYRGLLKAGWKKEDARQLLPIGTVSQIVVTANWRAWRFILNTRTAKVAHWEIRAVMTDLLKQLTRILPAVFEDIKIA